MRNKGLIIFLTSVVSLLCLYYLSFTWLDARVQKQATQHATSEAGHVDFIKKQAYLDSVWKKPIFTFLGVSYTYEEVKEKSLNLGLDLQGGMHVTLEVSPVELIKGLAGNSKDEAFHQAIEMATQRKHTQAALPFTKLFYQAYKQLRPEGRLSDIFATAANRSHVTRESSDQEVLKYLDAELDHAINRAFDIVRSRIDRFGTSQPNIQRLQGTGKIQIELPGVNNPERVRKLLQGVAQLRFWKVYDFQELIKPLEAIDALLTKEEQLAQSNKKVANQETSAASKIKKLGYSLTYPVEDVAAIQQILDRPDVKSLLPKDLLWVWDVKSRKDSKGVETLTLYPIKAGRNYSPLLEGDVITDARQVFDEQGRPAISMQMNGRGAKMWKKITASNIGKAIAITLDNQVYSAPVVNTEIPNGSSQITGNFSIEEAKDLANILKAGSLPAPVKITEEAIIGPTLSKVAQWQGMLSMALGMAVIVLFMLLYYAKGGIVANLALLFNIVFILGILAQFNAALTLPGIAGIVLTIGMSIDANVLIFERIREELRRGRKLQEAIQLGYQKANSSIVDANVTTLLTGIILYGLGQGPVRGFATTLMIGIITSFFTAVFITRLIFSWLVKRHRDSHITFAYGYNKNLLIGTNINFIGKRSIFYGISVLITIIGFLLLMKQGGLSLGVDFTGGRGYVIKFSESIEPTLLKTKLADHLGDQSVEVKTYGANNIIKLTTSYRINEESDVAEEEVKRKLIATLQDITGWKYVDNAVETPEATFTIASTTKVGPSIAGDIQASAKKSIIFTLLVIFGYILVRFRKWQFGLAALIALFHDVLAVFAAFGIARAFGYTCEIDQVIIAAILTVVGYSINDTVVIFDRIRETQRANAKLSLAEIANRSINETLSRTLITSLTTLAVVLILLVWGGEVLRGFSFTLFVGIAFGTYSSICVAAPLILDFSKKGHTDKQEKTNNQESSSART
jgi:SecD/SecF fusion protein